MIGFCILIFMFFAPMTVFAEKIPWPTDITNTYKGGFSLYAGHNGMDINALSGSVLYAPFDGKATYYQRYRPINGTNVLVSYGNYVEIVSYDGTKKIDICHMSSFKNTSFRVGNLVNAIDYWPNHEKNLPEASWNSSTDKEVSCGTFDVMEGDILGYSGGTGRSTGPHLHVTLYINGALKDPYSYFDDTISALDHAKRRKHVSIDSDIPTLYVYQANTFLYSVSGDAQKTDVQWTTDNPAVLEVNNKGDIKGKKAGTATVTAYLTDSKGETISLDKRTVKVQNCILQFKNKKLTVDVGKSKTLPLENKGITGRLSYKSSDKAVVTVDSNGRIIGKKSGKAVITVKYGMYSSQCRVTVRSTIKLNNSSVTLNKGKKFTLKATVNGSKETVKWSTSNKKVATVDRKGKVTAKGKGTCTITAACGSLKAKCRVTVKVPTITLSQKKITLCAGSFLKLIASVDGASQTVTWKSSKTKVVSVKNGQITANNEGTATITASANGVSATCKVTVKPTLSLSATSMTLSVKQTEKLTAMVRGSKKKVTWSSSNKSIASVDGKGNVTAKKNGTCTIKAKLGKISVSCKVKVEDNQEYKKLYYDFLKQGEKSFTFKLFSNNYTDKARSFWLLNLNDDGIPELIVSIDSCGQETLAVYTVSNHKVTYCGFICDKGSSRYDKVHRALYHSWWTNGNGGAGEKLLRVEGTALKVYKYSYAYNEDGKRVYKIGDNEATARKVSAETSSSFHKKWFDNSYLESRERYVNKESVRQSLLK